MESEDVTAADGTHTVNREGSHEAKPDGSHDTPSDGNRERDGNGARDGNRDRDGNRERIVAAAARLLSDGGPDAVSTRAVSSAAGVQPPTIYRLFGDKQGLLDAVVAYGFTEYLSSKAAHEAGDDPVEDLRAGWDLHIGLGLANPALYSLMYGGHRPGVPSPAAVAAFDMLARLIRRIAEAGRLAIPEERAAALVHAAGCGTTLTLIATPEARRDPELSRTAREAAIAAITTDAPAAAEPGPVAAAVTLRAALPRTDALTVPERNLLREWLDRIADPAR
ncbi:TetR/AcrR family transcriptional regulator [Streptomyces sp. 8ZJF_21]|uniref:TetR/AcrR family transcriptional regulator n=1 Tax=Streptomyces sp. 8ZJF_21 TaxID=2903141 RepID=UPI001E3DE1DD|nr:TetR/AcrR family transcriptional regulator [Streptomyces sp. 8ZJF_21]MCD9590654.1 TetR/AcrR family transcriptional regulator [Streptomyces sp. 8ZJF_21]